MADPNYRADVLFNGVVTFQAPDIRAWKALSRLASIAIAMLLVRKPVTVKFDLHYDRPKGWPLPIKKAAPGEPQDYRPLAILDFVEYQLDQRDRAGKAPAGAANPPILDTNVDDLV